jgi:adenosylhomocysteine nucleosidase
MTRAAIIAALPGELKPLVRGWAHERRGSVDLWRWKFDEGEWIAACAGAGQSAATRAFAEIEKDGPMTLAISVGWAGALREEFECGKTYRAGKVIDVKTGETFQVAHWWEELLVATSPKVADSTEKKRLASTYGAALVDMEGAAVARLAAMRGIPFYCIKAVSDGLNDRLPDFNRFIASDGSFQLTRLALYAAFRPQYWPALIRMGENSRRASKSLAEAVLDFLDERGTIRERNGHPNFQR